MMSILEEYCGDWNLQENLNGEAYKDVYGCGERGYGRGGSDGGGCRR